MRVARSSAGDPPEQRLHPIQVPLEAEEVDRPLPGRRAEPFPQRTIEGQGGQGARETLHVARRDQPVAKVVESCAYYLNPFEWWAYSRDDHWPPSGKVAGLGWRRPIVRPLRRAA